MSGPDEMISIQGLTKRFDALTAVDNITFTVKRGEVLGFLGPNGAGKSTTMKMVTGYLPITSGRASVCGYDVENQALDSRHHVGYLPEGAPLYGDMTTEAFLGFIAEVRGFAGAEKKQRIEIAVKRLGLEPVFNRPIETLSKGFKRRVGFAQAILHDPEVLILDEPTDGLDPNQKFQVRELIKTMAAEKAIVISTHILEEVTAVCTRAVIIAHGKLVFDGTPEALASRSPTRHLDDVFRELTIKH
jgi:ABC-2 type transport system ATP-binding protein